MQGRLGNQLFVYAAARALQQKYYPNYKLHINFVYLKNLPEHIRQDSGWENSLKYFNITDAECMTEPLPRSSRPLSQLIVSFIIHRICMKLIPSSARQDFNDRFFCPLLCRTGIYSPRNSLRFIKPVPSRSKVIICNGGFQHAGYFDDIRDILLEEFTPLHDVLPENAGLLSGIQNSESVCVTIRRGDFLSEKLKATFNVCNPEYFYNAMREIRKEIPGCRFFVFSDDVDDVKRVMNFPFAVTYERGNDPVWEKLRLMYSCKHFIISNSSFSWWAQYLSRNNNKIVYAPRPWLWGLEQYEGLYLPYMRVIQCHKH